MAVSFSIFQLVNLNIYETFERLCFNESKGKKGIQCINYCQSKIVEMCQMLFFFSWSEFMAFSRKVIYLVEVVNLVLWHLRMKIPLG